MTQIEGFSLLEFVNTINSLTHSHTHKLRTDYCIVQYTSGKFFIALVKWLFSSNFHSAAAFAVAITKKTFFFFFFSFLSFFLFAPWCNKLSIYFFLHFRFDVLVNGGGAVTLQFQRSPFHPMTRTVFVPWNQVNWIARWRILGFQL